MTLRLHTRISLTIVGLLAILVAVLSAIMFVQFSKTMDETRRANARAMEVALLKQAEKRGLGLAQQLSESLANPLYKGRWDTMRDFTIAARDQRGVDSLQVFDDTGKVILDGTDHQEGIGIVLDAPDIRGALQDGRSSTRIDDGILRAIVPIAVGSHILGGICLGLTLDDIEADIAWTAESLKHIGNTGMSNLYAAVAVALVVFLVAGILAGVAVARGLSRPIERLVALTRQIGGGASDLSMPVRHGDEIGELGAALVSMARERKEAEDMTRQLQAEIAHVSRVSTMGEMAGGLAHELNQPLTAIANYTRGSLNRLRREGATAPDIVEAMERAVAESLRAGEIIKRIRALVQKSEPERTRLDLNAAIRETMDILRAEAKNADVAIHLDLSGQIPPVLADKIAIQQVILNLARNGIDAAREGGAKARHLVVSTGPAGEGFVEMAFRDPGPGMEAEVRERMFDAFFTTKPNGLGMGLTICRSIVDAHDGHIEVERGTDGGTVFRALLPDAELAEAAAEAAAGGAASAADD